MAHKVVRIYRNVNRNVTMYGKHKPLLLTVIETMDEEGYHYKLKGIYNPLPITEFTMCVPASYLHDWLLKAGWTLDKTDIY